MPMRENRDDERAARRTFRTFQRAHSIDRQQSFPKKPNSRPPGDDPRRPSRRAAAESAPEGVAGQTGAGVLLGQPEGLPDRAPRHLVRLCVAGGGTADTHGGALQYCHSPQRGNRCLICQVAQLLNDLLQQVRRFIESLVVCPPRPLPASKCIGVDSLPSARTAPHLPCPALPCPHGLTAGQECRTQGNSDRKILHPVMADSLSKDECRKGPPRRPEELTDQRAPTR